MTKPSILIVDDEVRSLEALERTLSDDFEVFAAESTAQAERLLAENWVQVILRDQRMPQETGVANLTRLQDTWPDVIRIIAASSGDLDKAVAEGPVRKDLQFTLAGVTIAIPPLRDRRGDVPILANYLLKRAISAPGKDAAGFKSEARSCPKRHEWPGNVRELRNEIERMLVMGPEGGELGADLISTRVLMALSPVQGSDLEQMPDGGNQTLKDRVEAIEARILRESLIRHRWNKSRTAREPGLSRVGLPVGAGEHAPVAVQHVVRSIDPSMVWTVH